MTTRIYKDKKDGIWVLHVLTNSGSIVRVEWFESQAAAERRALQIEVDQQLD